jgi:hypothetical protein
MGRYRESDVSTLLDVLLPPETFHVEIKDKDTGQVGTGGGMTKEEARNNAWKNLHEQKK